MLRKSTKLKVTCRMCAKRFINDKSLLMLHTKYKHLKDYPINIIQKYFAQFLILDNDGLPQQICVKCLNEFKAINAFIEQCLTTQLELRNEYHNLNSHTNKIEDSIATPKGHINEKVKNCYIKLMKNEVKNNLLEENQIENINEDTTKTDIENLNMDNDFELYLMSSSSDISENIDSNSNDYNNDNYDNNYDDNDNNSKSDEEYFNDGFQEDFTITCQFCNKIFDNINDLDEHEIAKHKMKLYNKNLLCEHCGAFVIHYRFVEHIKGIHEDKKLYVCEDCGKDFKIFRTFKEHSIKYHQSDRNQITYDNKKKFPCLECGRVYLTSGNLKNHIKNVHSGSIDSSKKTNKQKISMPLEFQCDICKIKFRNIVSMEKHRTNHMYEKYEHKFECPQCDRRFGRRDHLKYHIKLEHLKEKPYKCQHCNKSFVIGFQLNTHMKAVHSKDKHTDRARCDNCGKTFYHYRYLLRHQKERHSFDAQFICVICNEKFFKHIHLLKHSQIHNIEKSMELETERNANSLDDNSLTEAIEYVIEEDIKNDNTDNEIEMAVSILIKNED